MAGICGVALLAWGWWAARKPSRFDGDELQRLRRLAESIHREQVQPFD